MKIDLSELYSNIKNSIELNEVISFSKDLIQNAGIKALDNVLVKGSLFKDSSDLITLKCNVKGSMLIEDSISLDDILYPFDIDIEENIEEKEENNENTIDLVSILWQNIVLEVPLKYTKVKDLSEFNGDGWKLISEEEVKINNPFLELKDKMKEE